MPIFVTIPVNVPPTLQVTPEMLSDSIAPFAQEFVDHLAKDQSELPKMSFADLEKCIPLEVAFDRLREKNHNYYAARA